MTVWNSSIVIERRGAGIPPEQRSIAERLRKQALALQVQFEMAEHSAKILEAMLAEGSDGVATAVDATYEAHTFVVLRMQLFRLLLVDLYACVLDDDTRTASVRSVLKELRRDDLALDALRAYYGDPSAIDVAIDPLPLDQTLAEQALANERQRISAELVLQIEEGWKTVDKGSSILNTDAARRMCWARVKATAHFERTVTGLVALTDQPPWGDGPLTWREPIDFLHSVAPYVYDVIGLLSANRWTKSYNTFYVRAFWDRFKNGRTALEPPPFQPLT